MLAKKLYLLPPPCPLFGIFDLILGLIVPYYLFIIERAWFLKLAHCPRGCLDVGFL
jgi:hypothetical protein